jgi:AIPR protein
LDDKPSIILIRPPSIIVTTLTVSSDAEGGSIKLEVLLHDWGGCTQPYASYYGQVAAGDIGAWWVDHHQLLFAKNLRKFTGSTEVNEAIKNTLMKDPAKFWYFNNGITILCNRLQKKRLGGSKTASGVFVCEGVSVVNGAQTVGCIGEVAIADPDALIHARVGVRLISLANCPDDFGSAISRAANTQNRIERRDFAALDPEQERLRKELHLDLEKTYIYKSGDTPEPQTEYCTIEEATIALACANEDATLAVQAKREIGKLWEDITKVPYKLLFNGSLSALKMWRLVELLRVVDNTLRDGLDTRRNRERMVAVHGNRFILQQIFRQVVLSELDDPHSNFELIKANAAKLVPVILASLVKHVDKLFKGSYVNSLFKNASKCQMLTERLAAERSSAGSYKKPASKKRKQRRSLA